MGKWIKIILLLFSFNAFSQGELIFNVHKSPFGIDWSSPKNLVSSTVKNSLYAFFRSYSHSLGHVSITLQCPDQKIDRWTGMARKSKKESTKLVLFKGAGLATLLHNFQGKIETKEDIEPDVELNMQRSEAVRMIYKINREQCIQLNNHIDMFLAKNNQFNYGLPNSPLENTGSGCSAYAMSFLIKTNLYDKNLGKLWSDYVHIPEELIGPYNSNLYSEERTEPMELNNIKDKISIFTLLFTDKTWASPNNPDTKSVYYWSPDKMYEWAQQVIKDKSYPIKKNKNSFDILLN